MRSTKKINLEILVLDFLRKKKITEADTLLAAFSGGPDSACLLHILHTLKGTMGYSLSAAYIEHGLRPEKERVLELKAVEAFCGARGIPLYIKKIRPGLIETRTREAGGSTEAVARRIRYGALRRIAGESGATKILLGHTLDDTIETIVMRFFQGSGERGLAGISPERGVLLRPLLTVEKSAVMLYLRQKKVKYSVDSTNDTSKYLRNRVRSVLLPAVASVFPGYKKSLSALGEKMTILKNYLDSLPLHAGVSDLDAGAIPLQLFNRLTPYERLTRLYGMISAKVPGARIPFHSIKPLLYGPFPDKKRLLQSLLGRNLQVAEGKLFYSDDVVSCGKNSYFIVAEGEGEYFISKDLTLTILLKENEEYKKGFTIFGCFPPFLIRSRLPGDCIETPIGRKKLKKLFIDWGIPQELKNLVCVVEDKRGIAAVLGKPFGYKNIAPQSSKVGMDLMTKPGEKEYTFHLTYTGVL